MLEIEDNDVDAEAETDEPVKRSKAPLFIGLALFLLFGGGGFYGVYSGMIGLPFGGEPEAEEKKETYAAPGAGPAFVPVGEMVIPLGPNARSKFLIINMEIETAAEDAAAMETLRPRLLDVFNTFLRAVEESDIEAPSATIRLRAQLLRRARAVAAPVEPRDLLITSFVLK